MKTVTNNNKEPLWIFLHLPKTGGTTFNGHLSKEMHFDEDFVVLSNWGYKYQKSMNRPPFHKRPPVMQQKIRVLSGHHTYYGIHRQFTNREHRYLTFLRDPAERCVSLYNFRKSKHKIHCNFEEWYDLEYNKNYRNDIIQFYCERLLQLKLSKITRNELSIAKKMLDLCWFVGVTDKLDIQLNFLFSEIGVNLDWQKFHVAGSQSSEVAELLLHPSRFNKIVKYICLNDEIRDKVYKDHPYDLELFHYGLEKNYKFDHLYNEKKV